MRNSIILFFSLIPATALANTAKLDVTSSAFTNTQAIPTEYTCEGANVSPPIRWSAVPASTKSVALLVEDPEATKGTFTHWLVTDIPASVTSLDKSATPVEGAIAQKNDKGDVGYTGPCPPTGRHHYTSGSTRST